MSGQNPDDAELRAIEAPDDETDTSATIDPVFIRRSLSSHGRPSSHEPASQPRSDGQVLSASAVVASNPYGSEEDECCGVCLENPGPGGLISLWCCRNVLCVKDVQLVGACPFCREEPVMWDIKLPPTST